MKPAQQLSVPTKKADKKEAPKKEAPKKEAPKKQEPKKKEAPKKAEKKEVEVIQVEKPKNPLDLLPESPFNFFDFKTLITNA